MSNLTRSDAPNLRRPNKLVRFVKTPKGCVIIALVILALVSIVLKRDVKSLETVIAATLTGIIVDLVVGLFYTRKRFVSDGGIITGLIVGMVMGSFSPLYVTMATTAIALAAKHVLRIKRKPIFNPAAVGLLVANYVFASMQSWWGGMSLLSYWYLIPLVVIGLFVTWRVKKLPQVISFLAAYGLMSALFLAFPSTHMDASYAFQNPMINSALFLAFFMITDPPTSPAQKVNQVWFGALTGVLSVGVYLIDPSELSYLLIGLLAANLLKVLQAKWLPVGARKRPNSAAVQAK